jgi:hypothetical protein
MPQFSAIPLCHFASRVTAFGHLPQAKHRSASQRRVISSRSATGSRDRCGSPILARVPSVSLRQALRVRNGTDGTRYVTGAIAHRASFRTLSRHSEAGSHNADTPAATCHAKSAVTLRHGIEHGAQHRLPSLAPAQQHQHRERA